METFEISVSGMVIVQADTYEDAIEQVRNDLANVLTESEVG